MQPPDAVPQIMLIIPILIFFGMRPLIMCMVKHHGKKAEGCFHAFSYGRRVLCVNFEIQYNR